VIGSRAKSAASTAGLLRQVEAFRRSRELVAAPKQAGAAVAVVRRFLWQQQIAAASQITPAAVQQFLANAQAQGRARKTLWNYRSAISAFCRHLVGCGILPADPCRGVGLARPAEVLPRYLSQAEISQALQVARRHGFWPEAALALATGLRLGEMIRLQWSDVDLTARSLSVRESKSGRPRILPLSAAAVEALQEQARVSGGFNYVFPARKTHPGGFYYRDRRRAEKWWKLALRPIQAAVPKFTAGMARSATGRGWHLFRHTFASRAAQAGVSLYKLAAWLGHSDVRTVRIYAHLAAGYDEDIERGQSNGSQMAVK